MASERFPVLPHGAQLVPIPPAGFPIVEEPQESTHALRVQKGAGPRKLEGIPLGRVVARGHGQRPGGAAALGGQQDRRRGGDPQIHDLRAHAHQPGASRVG